MVFRVQPHVRLHEWVADELGLFRAEGLDYEFETAGFAGGTAAAENSRASVASASSAPLRIRAGAFDDLAEGRDSDSPYRRPADVAGVEVGVGYHSGSHYSALQAPEPFLSRDQIALGFIGRPFDRVRQLIARSGPGEQLGYRKLVDTTFGLKFLLSARAGTADVQRYFRALPRGATRNRPRPHRHTPHWAEERPACLLRLVDVRRFGPGERVVDAAYGRDMFERTQGWMRDWNMLDEALARYEESVLI